MDAGSDQGHGMHVTYAGPRGRLDIDELAGTARLVVRKLEHRDVPTTRYGMPYEDHALTITPADAVAPTRAVLEALLAGKNYPDGKVGRMAVEVLTAAYLSDEQGGRTIALGSARSAARSRISMGLRRMECASIRHHLDRFGPEPEPGRSCAGLRRFRRIAFNRSFLAWADWGFAPTYHACLDPLSMAIIGPELAAVVAAYPAHAFLLPPGCRTISAFLLARA